MVSSGVDGHVDNEQQGPEEGGEEADQNLRLSEGEVLPYNGAEGLYPCGGGEEVGEGLSPRVHALDGPHVP